MHSLSSTPPPRSGREEQLSSLSSQSDRDDDHNDDHPLSHHHEPVHWNLIDSGSAGKERFAKEHLGEDAAETPHVDAEGVTLGRKQDLGRPAHQHDGGDVGHEEDESVTCTTGWRHSL